MISTVRGDTTLNAMTALSPSPRKISDLATHFQLHLENLRPAHVPSTTAMRAYASEAGICQRRLYYRLSHHPLTDPDSEPDLITSTIAFHIGNNLHDEFQGMMERLYPNNFTGEVKWHYPEAPSIPIVSGRCDGLYTDHRGKRIALEIKSMSSWLYKTSLSSGNPLTKHALQAALSMYILKADEVQVVYLCKDWIDPEKEPISIWTYPVRPNVPVSELNHMARVLRLVQGKAPAPPRIARGEAITNIDKDSECRFCPFKEICELDGP